MYSKRFDNKIAVVTASTQGIGFSIAERLAKEGAKVIISSRNDDNVQLAVNKLKSQGLIVIGIVCHVTNSSDRKKLFEEVEKCGGLDILISNAAVNPSIKPILNCDETSWDKIFDVNVKASFLLAKEALPFMQNRPYGRIIFISSVAGLSPINMIGAYSVSKTALIGLSKAIALQLAKKNITVNCIAPGIIPTKFANVLIENDKRMNMFLSNIPMKRFGAPEDISSIVAFLSSSEANYITGETIVVAGGVQSRL